MAKVTSDMLPSHDIVCFIGVAFDKADNLEHSVKDGIMRKRNYTAEERIQVYDTDTEERYISKSREDE